MKLKEFVSASDDDLLDFHVNKMDGTEVCELKKDAVGMLPSHIVDAMVESCKICHYDDDTNFVNVTVTESLS